MHSTCQMCRLRISQIRSVTVIGLNNFMAPTTALFHLVVLSDSVTQCMGHLDMLINHRAILDNTLLVSALMPLMLLVLVHSEIMVTIWMVNRIQTTHQSINHLNLKKLTRRMFCHRLRKREVAIEFDYILFRLLSIHSTFYFESIQISLTQHSTFYHEILQHSIKNWF